MKLFSPFLLAAVVFFLAVATSTKGYDVAYSYDSLVSVERLNSESSRDASMSVMVNTEGLEKEGLEKPVIKDVWAMFGNNRKEDIVWNDDEAAAKFLVDCMNEEKKSGDNSESEKEFDFLTLQSKPDCSRVMHIVDAGQAVQDYVTQLIPDELIVKFRIPHDKIENGKPLHVHVAVEDGAALQKRDAGSSPTFHMYGRRDFVITSSTEKVPSRVRSSKDVSDISVSSGVTNSTNTGLWVLGTILVATGVCMGIFLLVHWIKGSSALTF